MPRVAPCPRCNATLVVRSLDDARRRLRCPHCSEEFLASHVAELGDEVPEAIEVQSFEAVAAMMAADAEAVPATSPPAEPALGETSSAEAPAVDSIQAPDEASESPELSETTFGVPLGNEVASQEPPLDAALAADPAHDEPADEVSSSVPPPLPGATQEQPSSAEEASTSAALSTEPSLDQPAEAPPVQPTGLGTVAEPPPVVESPAQQTLEQSPPDQPPPDPSPWDQIEQPVDDQELAAASFSTATSDDGGRMPRRRSSGPGVLTTLIGIVGGGIMGLALGYAVLMMIDARYDFLKLGEKIRDWFPSEEYSQSDDAGDTFRSHAHGPWA